MSRVARRLGCGCLALLLAAVAMAGLGAAALVVFFGGQPQQQQSDCSVGAALGGQASPAAAGLPSWWNLGGAGQARATNAATIVNVGRQLGVPERGLVVAIATAIQESKLENLDHGDRDSLGLFQQRPSQGWGTPAQVRDPVYAATQFYATLTQIPGWETMPVTVAAQRVQRSGFPDAYAQWEPLARSLVAAAAGPVAQSAAPAAASAVPAGTQYRLSAGTTPSAVALANRLGPMFGIKDIGGWRASARDPRGHPSGNALDFMVPSDSSDRSTAEGTAMGNALVDYATKNAAALGIDYIIWHQKIWRTSNPQWVGMADRGSNNENHFNHVHINIVPGSSIGNVPPGGPAGGCISTQMVGAVDPNCPGGDVTGYGNGQLPAALLCPLAGTQGQMLRADAANSFNQLTVAYAQQFGQPICVTDSYRPYADQVRLKAAKPFLAAAPGKSNHGWGRALDLCGGLQNFGTAQHNWMRANAPRFGWCDPPWARAGGSKPEPWHWEFANPQCAGV